MISANLIVQNLVNGILLGGLYALMSVGLSLIWGLMRVSNSAHAAFSILAAFFAYWLFEIFRIDPIVSLPLTFGLSFGAGVLTQKFLIRRLLYSDPFLTFMLTFSLAIVMENGMILVWGNKYASITTGYSAVPIELFGLNFSLIRVIAFAIAISAFVILGIFLKYTYTGKAARAVVDSKEAASLMGINVDSMYALCFGIATGTAGLAGSLIALIYTFFPSLQGVWIARLFAIIILGGMGNLWGTLLSALLIGLAEVFIGTFVPVMWGSVAAYVILLLTLLVRPTGLLGRK
jgi:branched-chain amino acid transport system permease protein